MQRHTPTQLGATWLTQCMVDVKSQKIRQIIQPYATSSSNGSSGGGDALPVRSVVAASRIHRGEHIGTVKRECVLTGQSATQLLQRVCRGSHAATETTAPSSSVLQPMSVQSFDAVIRRVAQLPMSSDTPSHLLLSRDALLMATALYVARSPLHRGVLSATQPMQGWIDALPRRPPPMGMLLHRAFTRGADFEPLTRRVRLGQQTRAVGPGEDVSAASTALMVQAVTSGEVALADLQHPTVETALSTSVLTNYFKGRTAALTMRQHETQRARGGAAEREHDAIHLFLAWEAHLQTQFVQTLLPVLLTSASEAHSLGDDVVETPEWQAEEAVLRWAHFMVRSRCVNLHWRRPGPPRLSVIPLIDMLNHSTDKANVVYHCEDGGDVAVTASQTIQAGEELLLRYNHIGQRGCLFGDQPRPASPEPDEQPPQHPPRRWHESRTTAAAAREVSTIEKRQYSELYARDEDDEAAVLVPGTMASSLGSAPAASSAGHSPNLTQEHRTAVLAHREMQQEVQWLWRFGFLRSTAEKNREAAQLWSRGLRSRIAHLTDVRRKGRSGAFVIGVPEGLQHLREQRAQLERERYVNHRVFPPQKEQ